MLQAATIATLVVFRIFISSLVSSETRQDRIVLTPLASFDEPTDLGHYGGKLYVSERIGIIRDVANGSIFLDISHLVSPNLLSFVFDDQYVYTLYRRPDLIRVARFKTADDQADPDSQEILLDWKLIPKGIHNAGQLQFGKDGYLYWAIGDGDVHKNPTNSSQDLTTVLGAILRLDVNGGGLPADCIPEARYTVPASNPFVDGRGGTCDEIWQYGLRQPWRFSLDTITGDLWIGDVGLNQREEVNHAPAGVSGLNFGWVCYEGSVPFSDCRDQGNFVFAVHEYAHDNDRCSVTGGYVYNGNSISDLAGRYVFADFCSGEIFMINSDQETEVIYHKEGQSWVTFGIDDQGELYIADYTSGTVFRLDTF